MGCDITHQFQVFSGGQWKTTHDTWQANRNYDLFSALAGVRGECKPIANPRGLPKGQTLSPYWEERSKLRGTPLFCVADDGYFAHSWLLMSEIQEAIHQYPLHVQESIFDLLGAMKSQIDEFGAENVRINFMFDS